MNRPVFLTGMKKFVFYHVLVVHVVCRYLLRVLQMKLSVAEFVRLIFRLVLFLKVLIKNKVVKIGDVYKLQLYLPAYPTPAFWESIEKFIRPDPGPLTVVFSITKACGYKCPHCYQRNDSGADLDMEVLKKSARQMSDVGVTMFDIEGGEPLLKFDRLVELLESFDGKRELWVNTTGHLLTPEKAKKLKQAGVFGVMISLHTPDEKDYNEFTGMQDAFQIARNAAKMFNDVGITVVLNSCPSDELFENNGVERIMEIANSWDCSFVQVIHGKSAGAWLGKDDEMIRAHEKIKRLCDLHVQYNSPGKYADYTAASVQVFEESPNHFGCTAGGIDRFYLNANGEVQPCEFLNVSFGNVNNEDFMTIFNRMRAFFRKPGTKWLCATESKSIHEMLKANNIPTTPVPARFTEKLVPSWQKGKNTPLYEKMGLYK
ncbi:MAG: radical SAM protein [Candidatus Riflebacteria bacterium]|nr:radical SAM protein [Candidatus Riflebacteria bacterium]